MYACVFVRVRGSGRTCYVRARTPWSFQRCPLLKEFSTCLMKQVIPGMLRRWAAVVLDDGYLCLGNGIPCWELYFIVSKFCLCPEVEGCWVGWMNCTEWWRGCWNAGELYACYQFILVFQFPNILSSFFFFFFLDWSNVKYSCSKRGLSPVSDVCIVVDVNCVPAWVVLTASRAPHWPGDVGEIHRHL